MMTEVEAVTGILVTITEDTVGRDEKRMWQGADCTDRWEILCRGDHHIFASRTIVALVQREQVT
jgi:hypothetical protein